jgi:hypothetical protein
MLASFSFDTSPSIASTNEIEIDINPFGSASISNLAFSDNRLVTPSTTSIVNLPIIEQNVAQETPSPESENPEPEIIVVLETFTPTPTPIPQQTGSTNLPIVIGAAAIILVVVLAWFFVSYLPEKKEK